jgi:hypothetical protein
MKKSINISLLAILLLSFGCKDKEVVEEEENELITTVSLTFKSGTSVITASFLDLDGEGGTAATTVPIVLKKDTEYTVEAEFADESKKPKVDITSEILEEAEEHLVIWLANPSPLAIFTATDKDSRSLPIGLKGKIKTSTTTGSGKLQLRLRHQPPVNGKPTKDGSAAPGSDDVNVEFSLTVN